MIFILVIAAIFALLFVVQVKMVTTQIRTRTSRFYVFYPGDQFGHPIEQGARPKLFAFALIWNILFAVALALGAVWLCLTAFAWGA